MRSVWLGVVIVFGGCSFVYDTDKYEGVDQLPPPIVDALQSPTNQNPLPMTGSAEPGAFVEVRGGAESVVSVATGDDGLFSIDVPLQADQTNSLTISQVNGPAESAAVTLEMLHDGIAPNTPVLDPVASPTRAKMVILQGSAEPGATIVVSDGASETSAAVDENGRFTVPVEITAEMVNLTQHDLAVVARDAATNESGPANTSVVHNPALPIDAPVLDAVAAFSQVTPIDVTGRTEPDLTVRIFGGATEVTTTADASGDFSANIKLQTNSQNSLSVFATVPALGLSSPATKAIVIHDDILPEAPTVDPIASPTGAAVVRVSGISEALAVITIAGGATDVVSSANENGEWAGDVTLTADSLNVLSIVAEDLATNLGPATTVNVEQDSTLEQPVIVDPVASPTNAVVITISGMTEAAADVEILGGASTVTITSAGDGSFSTSVTLNANLRNDLIVRRVASTAETFVVVFHDDVAPGAPTINAIASPTNQTNISVEGTAEPLVGITVSGGTAQATGMANGSGQYSIPVSIVSDATSSLTITATDSASNTSSPALASVTHSSGVPDSPVVDDSNPPPTSQPTHIVVGHVTTPGPDITIEIIGGAVVASGPTDESTGAFAVEVTLNANAENTLEAVSKEGAITSPGSIVTILHDDIAPLVPDDTKISVGSPPPLSSCLVRGQVTTTGSSDAVEPFSTVRVVNLGANNISASTTAGADGSFSATISVCNSDVLRFTARDAAGNVSPSVDKAVP